MPPIVHLPYIDFQPDALSVFDDVAQGTVGEEDVWVSRYQDSEPSIHAKLRLRKARDQGEETLSGSQRNTGGVEIEARDGLEVSRITHTTFAVQRAGDATQSTTIRFPRQTIEPPNPPGSVNRFSLDLNCIDANQQSTHVVYGGPDGYAYVQSTSDPKSATQLKGHIGDVLAAKWFPSGQVVLTASSDTTIRIWAADTGENPRTLTGHKRAVTSLGILGVGKNVISASKDGLIRLWDVGAGKSVHSMYTDRFGGVEKICLGKGTQHIKANATTGDDSQDTLAPTSSNADDLSGASRDQLVFAGLASTSGAVEIFDLSSKRSLGMVNHTTSAIDVPSDRAGGAVRAVAYDPDRRLLATGTSKGLIAIRDTRMLSLGSHPTGDEQDRSVLHLISRTQASINDLGFVLPDDSNSSDSSVDLIVASSSGLPYRARLPISTGGEESVRVVEEYAGWEPVPIESVSVGHGLGNIWLAGFEGGIRRY